MRKVAAWTAAVSASSGGRSQHAHVDAGGADRVEQRVEVGEPGGGAGAVVVARVAHAAHGRAGLSEGLARHLRDLLERRARLFGIRVDQGASRSGLHGDCAEVVADDVVDVARDPHALARGGLARLGGAELRSGGRSGRAPARAGAAARAAGRRAAAGRR